MARARPRRWLQFNLRHLLLIVVAVALLLGWWKPLRRDIQISVRAGPDGSIQSMQVGGRECRTTNDAYTAVVDALEFRLVNPEDAVLWIKVDESLQVEGLDELMKEFRRREPAVLQFVICTPERGKAFRLDLGPSQLLGFLGGPLEEPYQSIKLTLRATDTGDLLQIEADNSLGGPQFRNWEAVRASIEDQYLANHSRGGPDLEYTLCLDPGLRVKHLLDGLAMCCRVRDRHPDQGTVYLEDTPRHLDIAASGNDDSAPVSRPGSLAPIYRVGNRVRLLNRRSL